MLYGGKGLKRKLDKREKVKEGLDKCIYVDLPLKLGNNLLKQESSQQFSWGPRLSEKTQARKDFVRCAVSPPQGCCSSRPPKHTPKGYVLADMLKSILKGQTWIEVSNWPGLVSSTWHPILEKIIGLGGISFFQRWFMSKKYSTSDLYVNITLTSIVASPLGEGGSK